MEQKVAENIDSVIGRQGSGSNKEGSVRGNLQNPVSPDADNSFDREKLAGKFLKDQDKTVDDLIEDGIKKKDEEDAEKGCEG